MLSERKLKRWRREALKTEPKEILSLYAGTASALAGRYLRCQEHILKLTQELLDQHLLKGRKKGAHS